MPTISLVTTYDTDTRELRSVATLTGFVPLVPGQVSTGLNSDTIYFLEGGALQSRDFGVLQVSSRRALDLANDDLLEWQKVVANPDKAVALAEALEPPEEPEPEEPAP